MRNRKVASTVIALLIAAALCHPAPAADDLAARFATPPDSARPWVYWWWLNGYVSIEGIVRDLDEMRKQGIGGALVFHAGTGDTPGSTEFMSPPWREFFRFAVEEAAKRNITLGLNLCAGWNAGGPWVGPEDAAKMLVHGVTRVSGPATFSKILPRPAGADATYHDVAVLAWQLQRIDGKPEAVVCRSRTFVDLTARTAAGGRLDWEVPDAEWLVVRFGWQIPPKAHTKCTGGSSYLEIDPLSAAAMDKHFAATAGVLVEDVKPHLGKTFKYVHIDSGEIGHPDWTPTLGEQFQRLRGYDPFPYLAAKAGQVVDDPTTTERFLEDYQRTIGDLMIECYYGRLGELAHQVGLGTHSEAAGYQKPAVDALRSLGCNDVCMSEFWSRRSNSSQAEPYIHQLSAAQLRYHDGIKNASSAAHVYGRRIVQAEAFTVMRRVNYDRDPFDLKDVGDRAFCAGLNRNMLCFYVSQPEEQSKPGYAWPGVGMEFDRHVTWWPMSSAWIAYLSRCQHLLQEGRFVADVCYLQGDWVPAYVPAKWAMDPPLPSGYDCDTINSEALRNRTAAGAGGQLTLPDGQSYRYLVLWQGGRWQMPSHEIFARPSLETPAAVSELAGSGRPLALSPGTLRAIKKLVEGGVTLVGPRPSRAIGLEAFPGSDAEVKRLADELWGAKPATSGGRKVGGGRVIWGRSLADVIRADNLSPDLEIHEDRKTLALPADTLSGIPHPGSFDWIHRTIQDADVYFVANLRNAAAAGEFIFRVEGRGPELWDPVTGKIRTLPEFTPTEDGRTRVPMKFMPRESFFVVFRRPASGTSDTSSGKNFQDLNTVAEITGPWEVSFDTRWGGPNKAIFRKLEDWTKRPEKGIKYYSGTATYRNTFDLAEQTTDRRLYLDLGSVRNLARIRLNHVELSVVWTAPRRVEITRVVKPKENVLEVEVVNLWINRLIGDASLPNEERFTISNASDRFTPNMPLLPSGLLGPVRILAEATEP